MNTLVRSTTTRNFSRRFDGYESLDLNSEAGRHEDHQHHRRNNSSKRRKQPHSVVKTFSYRRDRARTRQIYLKSYTLTTSRENLGKSGSGKLKKVAIKVKAVAVSVVAFIRMDSFRSCNTRSATDAFSPTTLCLRHSAATSHATTNPNPNQVEIASNVSVVAVAASSSPSSSSPSSLTFSTRYFSINAEFSVTVEAENRNEGIGFNYGKESTSSILYRDKTLCAGKLPAFEQPGKNVTMIKVVFKGKREFGLGLLENLKADNKAGKVPLLIVVKAPITVVIGKWPLRQFEDFPSFSQETFTISWCCLGLCLVVPLSLILRDMASYPFDKQVKIVIATMAIHNYIRRHAKCYHHFEKIENDPNFILEEDNDRDDDFQEENHNANTPESREVKKLRDSITARLDITCYSSVSYVPQSICPNCKNSVNMKITDVVSHVAGCKSNKDDSVGFVKSLMMVIDNLRLL
ncbi:hypothetical protein EZV62_020456 [Acer yangbiense]|uniref:Late embryogenesis abundant protein LEA-2 subgroup domain-containing protein n=1 Tax=Acer yangbiense TaxID=1000413 RepID=A0A5C7HDW5_9ROSI|nr:hypothetical protein EZV62_020456 [Acer yangbiense]